jgi:2-oxo-4-hydroxy-4-carboxy-5-ureidoimidazoline decarboxylase
VSLAKFNRATKERAQHLFLQCCSSERWIERMLIARPFGSDSALFEAADQAWEGLAEEDFLQAFKGHPKIGDVSSLKAKYAGTKELAAGEQSSVNEASMDVIEALAHGNSDYQARFGFIFIVCATGKSAGEMLALLQARLPNSREQELTNAAEEQRKIFQLRLEKFL